MHSMKGLKAFAKGPVETPLPNTRVRYMAFFLASLTEEDCNLLEASEGLGNSQKAEVAWLDKKGYAYTEVEIDVSTWLK